MIKQGFFGALLRLTARRTSHFSRKAGGTHLRRSWLGSLSLEMTSHTRSLPRSQQKSCLIIDNSDLRNGGYLTRVDHHGPMERRIDFCWQPRDSHRESHLAYHDWSFSNSWGKYGCWSRFISAKKRMVRVLCNLVAINLSGLSHLSPQTKYTWAYTLCRWRRCRVSNSDHDAPRGWCCTCNTSTYIAYMLTFKSHPWTLKLPDKMHFQSSRSYTRE